jgi:hypothetical protein
MTCYCKSSIIGGHGRMCPEYKNLPLQLVCKCLSEVDVKPVQFRNGWGASSSGFDHEIFNLCKKCRSHSMGSWRYSK